MSEIMTDDEKRAALKARLRRHPEEIVEVYREWREQNLGLNEVSPDKIPKPKVLPKIIHKRRERSGATLSEGRKASKRRQNEKRSVLGHVFLNSPFPGCVKHHINLTDVIYIPKVLHRSNYHNQWTGQGMDRINSLARQYL